jgi:DNA invertase Pin-like site-specific DNA recombinase
MSKTYACWRVSSNEQNEARQLKAFRECGEKIDEIFGDKLSGKSMDRPDYQRMVAKLEPGDLVIFSSLDRMSRSYDDIAEEWRYITKEKGADILILDMRDLLDTRKGKDLVGTLISDIVVKLLSYVAETERKNIRKRQREGIDAMLVDENGKRISKKTGRGFGRQEKRPDNFTEVLKKQRDGELTLKEALELTGIGRTKWYELSREISCRA